MSDTTITAQSAIDNSLLRAMDPDKTRYTDAQALIFLNKAYDYIQKLLIKNGSNINTVTATISLEAETGEYLLSEYLPDFWAMADEGVYIGSAP